MLRIAPVPAGRRDDLYRLERHGFFAPFDAAAAFFELVGLERTRGVFDGEELIGAWVGYDLAHWFGGRAVRSLGVGGVTTAPQVRGRGVGRFMLTELLRAAQAGGYALSTLYPASWTLYRKFGWDFGGMRTLRSAPLATLPTRSALEVRSARDADKPRMEAIQRNAAKHANGRVQRDAVLWTWALQGWSRDADAWVVESGDGVAGYFALRYATDDKAIEFTDCAFADPAAADAALAFAASYRTQAHKLVWRAADDDPILLRLSEEPARVMERKPWFLRIVDIGRAFAERGYARGVATELTFAVEDEILPENAGVWRLTVDDGVGVVARVDATPEARLPIAALAPLFSGHASLAALVAAGRAEASEEAQDKANAIFAGPAPAMPDFF